MTPPSDFTCPITKKLMVDPVVSPQGINFERSAILKWTQDGNKFCPVTSAPLRLESLRTSTALQWKIKYFQMKHNTSSDESDKPEQEPTNVVIPQNMMCPLTKKVMVDPVMTKYGHNYERAAIIKWIGVRGEVCPMTGKPLSFSSGIVTNSKLSWKIVNWERKIKNGKIAPQLPAADNKLKLVVHSSCSHSTKPNPRGLVGNFLKMLHSSHAPTPLDEPESVLALLDDVASIIC
jgi:hypothetical protein